MMQRNIPVKRGDGGSEGRKTTTTPCCSKEGLKRGPWTPEEDELLARYVKKEGEGRWKTLPKRAGLFRCGKSCRLRWMNYLKPSVKRGPIAPDEEDMILRLHRLLGNRWSLIAGRIPGRTDNEIKNYWNTHLSKKLISRGIDPRTHKPLQDSKPPNPNPDPNSKPEPTPSSFLTSIPTYLSVPLPPTLPPLPPPTSTPEIHPPNTTSVSLMYDQSHDHNVNFMTKSNNFGHIIGSRGEMVDIPAESSQDGNCDAVIGDIDCSTEDIFSSFLNSLINEDIHIQQQHMQYSHEVEPFDHVPGTP